MKDSEIDQKQVDYQDWFRSAFEYAAIGIALLALDGRFLKVNQSLCSLVGLTEPELLKTDWQSIIHPDDLAPTLNYIEQILVGQISSYSMEKRYCHKLGNIVWVIVSMSLARNEQGQPSHLVAQIQNISERKRSEETLLQLASIVESSDDAIISISLEGIILSWNLGAQKIYGYSIQEIIGKFASILLPPENDHELLDILEIIKQGGRLDNYETIRVTKNGQLIDVCLTISPLKDTTGKIVGAGVIGRDISDRKRIEETLKRLWNQNKLILNSAGEGICGLDKAGKIKFINPAAAQMLGYQVKELIDQPLNLIFQQSPSALLHLLTNDFLIYEPLKQGKIHQVNKASFWRKDGVSFPVEYISTPIQEEEQIVGVVLTFKDITERLAIEQMKEEFVSVVSHELRTPLTSIRGALGLLAGGLLTTYPEKAQRMLEIAVTNTDRLVRLINDILDIERIESGKVSMDKKVCDAGTLMLQAAEVIQAMADKANVTITVTPIVAQIWADPDRIIQTLTNLLSNAIKFSPSGSTVSLTAQWSNPSHSTTYSQILFQVKDQGRGIPSDRLESIFGRFQQVDVSDSRQKGGTGLGLAICRSIIQQHGGRIWAESVFGSGSTFCFTIPSQAPASSISHPSPLVLFCYDEPGVCDSVQMLIKQRGYRVVTATSTQKAVQFAANEQPAAILFYLIKPGINSWEIITSLKEQPDTRSIPIIIFSTLSIEENVLFPLEVLNWVNKPVDEASLFQTLEQFLPPPAHVGRVLLVEDDRDLGLVVNAMFERHQIETVQARTGKEAIQLLQQMTPDLLVLDLGLPECDGFSVVDWLKKDERLRSIPIVIYSAKDLNHSERERLQVGQTEFLTKGRIKPEEFEQRVIALLNHLISNQEESCCDHQASPDH